MNHLAHLFFARPSPESIASNLAADYYKGKVENHPPSLREGIRIHRRVDAFTDFHPRVAAVRRVVSPHAGHYAGVIIDVFFDHLLARSWERYSDEGLETFARRIYGVLSSNLALLPQPLALSVPRMIDDDWLVRYRDASGWRRALARMSGRLGPRVAVEPAVEELMRSRDRIDEEFQLFFPELVREIKGWRRGLETPR